MSKTYSSEVLDKLDQKVILKGWVHSRRDHGQVVFIDLRDSTGLVQIVFAADKDKKVFNTSQSLKNEMVVSVEGVVRKREEKYINTKIKTGTVEVEARKLGIISKSEEAPFPLDTDGREIDENIRLKYRYLDLRRERLQYTLRLRHRAIQFIRDFLTKREFAEIETPILTKATPEGARDFIVPSRLQQGRFYALPQSPQQYKQLLMVAGFERYFQIARCFRDEDPRADRAYGEFTQLDLEMSFATQDEILSLTEELMIEITELVLGKKVFQKPFPRFTYKEAMSKYGADKFDLRKVQDPEILAFAWVVDFPLFEKTETREIASMHHPFTAPKDEDLPLLETEPMKARSWQHDLVCNGHEVGGGSIRITDPKIQQKIFEILGHGEEEIQRKFGHLLEAFKYGVPPHGGIAPGIDRLLMVALNEPSLREVIAFPMTSGGRASVMEAPGEVSQEQLDELGIKVKENE
ncbi:aspartate--tRNA ligase [Patescibacteria group bacterium]|nr:aspartate--tRNA ligase [Patescibacteria group bacterium]